ncbi:MAG: pyruvate:ferredoxin (flavodoxin) oxidoreductase, partial [Bacteroidetes bacterium]
TLPQGTAAFEKRGVATHIPEWIADNCIQCNQCAYVCPHGVIRPFLFDANDKSKAPVEIETIPAVGKDLKGYEYRIQVSALDCTGCNVCAEVCPSKEKSLVMKPLDTQMDQVDNWDYVSKNISYKDTLVPKEKNLKNSQFAQPLFEFSGACAGCGETPYIKLTTQLFGDRMTIANATGCSSIYGGSAPSTPYTTNKDGKGPAWANSLFEDNAEFGFGMAIGSDKLRARIERKLGEAISSNIPADLKEAMNNWIATKEDGEKSQAATDALIPLLEKSTEPFAKEVLQLKQYMIKKSHWIFGGDGWAYDIGYGGLDHVIASGENVNILVLDTEVYSNTGGQSSKATPIGAVAKFASSGKKIRKKDLGAMAMIYGYVYVAQIAMGANMNHAFKVIKEAEAYPGPSLIIAYSPCIAHGLKKGMGTIMDQEKDAVKAGYWHLFKYNPTLADEGKNPFTLDSKEPDWNLFQEFLSSETRYTSLMKSFPEEAKKLFVAAEENSKWRYNYYKRLAAMDFTEE